MQNFILKHIESIISVCCIIFSALFWFFTMNGVPSRVTVLEKKVESIETQLAKECTKTDIILEDTKFIKQLIIQRHTN